VVPRLVEAARPPEEPWPIVGQQILVSTLERGEWPASDVIALLSWCFPELPEDGFQSMLTHMVHKGYLDANEGLLRVVPRLSATTAVGITETCWRHSVGRNS